MPSGFARAKRTTVTRESIGAHEPQLKFPRFPGRDRLPLYKLGASILQCDGRFPDGTLHCRTRLKNAIITVKTNS
jgi:hypothetical protein